MKKRWILFIIYFIVISFISLWLIRAFNSRYLDDVNPEIPCEVQLLEKADVFYVIPILNNESIANNSEWCKQILSYNKTLGMHGVYHTFNEFLIDRDQEYLEQGKKAFEECFGFLPKEFKPPQLRISLNNKKLKLQTFFLLQEPKMLLMQNI